MYIIGEPNPSAIDLDTCCTRLNPGVIGGTSMHHNKGTLQFIVVHSSHTKPQHLYDGHWITCVPPTLALLGHNMYPNWTILDCIMPLDFWYSFLCGINGKQMFCLFQCKPTMMMVVVAPCESLYDHHQHHHGINGAPIQSLNG